MNPPAAFPRRPLRVPGPLAGILILLAAVLVAVAAPALADLSFPALSGRVVDAANVLPATTRATLDGKLAAQEAKATDQFVVATVPSLQGTSIEDYANRLFRFWKLGQEKKNNGVLLLVAPNERKVRIEVGYGLEGILTDAVASTIIQTTILPAFRKGDMPAGIVAAPRRCWKSSISIRGGPPAGGRRPGNGGGRRRDGAVRHLRDSCRGDPSDHLVRRRPGRGFSVGSGVGASSSSWRWESSGGGGSSSGGFSGGAARPAAAALREDGDDHCARSRRARAHPRRRPRRRGADQRGNPGGGLSRPLIRHTFYPVLWAALAALALPWLLVLAVPLRPIPLLAVQGLIFLALLALLSVPALARRTVPPAVRRAAARRRRSTDSWPSASISLSPGPDS